MCSLLPILLCAVGSLQTIAATPMTADGVEKFVAATRHESDAELARQISGFELTERLSTDRLERCIANLPGWQAKEAILAIADMSAFLAPPADAVPDLAAPDLAAQRKITNLATNYVSEAVHNLPNLLATRVTNTFLQSLSPAKPPKRVDRFRANILYRDGTEISEAIGHRVDAKGLTTSCEFGLILKTAILDAARGHMTWSHWEKGTDGTRAVFRYAVGAKESHYTVDNRTTPYEGEITIDPSNGTILRIVLKADPAASGWVLGAAEIVVEYGPVELGGKVYVCPLKGIALSGGWKRLWLNDIVFERYHLFRPDLRILPGLDPIR